MSTDAVEMLGIATIQVIGPDGSVKEEEIVRNIITTIGDQYYAQRGANVAETTADVTGMKLGTGTTAVAKSGAGAALVTYISGSNNLFDATYPSVAAVGADVGYTADYVVTWAAGDVTNAAITEAVIVNDAGTDLTSAAAATISRIVFTAKNKTADDSLVITWKHLFNGS